jgi:AcrR family transcriptional regulator
VTEADGWARRRARIARDIERNAIELLAQHGDQGVTVEQIAGASGISVRTFFRYFPSRDDVLTALPRRLNDTTCRRVATRPVGERVLDSFIAAVHEGIDPDEEDLIRLWGHAVRRGFQPVAASDESMVTAYAEVIAPRLGVEPDDLHVQVWATAIAAVMWSTFVRWLEQSGQEPLAKLIGRSFDVLADLNREPGGPK